MDEIKANGGYATIEKIENDGIMYYKVCKGNRYGLTDREGKIIVPVEMEDVATAGNGFLKYKLNGFWGVITSTGKIIIDTERGYTSIGNFVTFTKRFPYTMTGFKGECDATGHQLSKIQVTSTSSSKVAANKSNKNSDSSSSSQSTIIVEHRREPQPMQIWVNCNICYGSGKCQVCNGKGYVYTYNGTSLCEFGCGGSGKCSFCAGQGGHYEVQYR